MTGQEIKAWRKARGISQEQLARMLGQGRRSIVAWEADETPIPLLARCAFHCVEMRDSLRQQLTMLQGGQMRTGEKRLVDGKWREVNTSAETIERLERQIAELDSLLGT